MTRKKVVGSKNVFYKSCRKFYILGGDFFSFWRNFKNEDSRAKKRFSDFAYKTRVFSPGAPKNIFFQKKTLQASYTHLLRWFRTIFNIGYGGGPNRPPLAPQRSKNSPPHEGLTPPPLFLPSPSFCSRRKLKQTSVIRRLLPWKDLKICLDQISIFVFKVLRVISISIMYQAFYMLFVK